MPLLTDDSYKPVWPFRWGQINTIYPYLFRKNIELNYTRERIITFDDDFVDIDFIRSKSKHLVILCHGLEGSSNSQYMQYTARLISNQSFDVAALNYRSCSGEMNLTATMYHSGFTHDLHRIIELYGERYDKISLVGFSLGGNMILKYLGDDHYPISPKIVNAIAMSVPCDLLGSSKVIGKWSNKQYETRFLVTLLEKMKIKQQQFPRKIKTADIKKAKSLVSFDEYFTGPLHGYKGAEDYYAQCSSRQFLSNIKIPTLLINAVDDPFLSPSCFPYEIAKSSKYLYFKAPKFGGHVGFTTFGQSNYWNEIETLKFIKDN